MPISPTPYLQKTIDQRLQDSQALEELGELTMRLQPFLRMQPKR